MDRNDIALKLTQGGVRSNMAGALADALDTNMAVPVPYAATVNLFAPEADVFVIAQLTGNITIDIPRQAPRGREIIIVLQQGGTVRTVTWSAAFRKSADGVAAANAKAATKFVFDGSHWVQIGGPLAWV